MATAGGTVTGATRKDEGARMANFERDRLRSSPSSTSAVGDRKRESMSGGKLTKREPGSIRARGNGSGTSSGISNQPRAAATEAGSAQVSRSENRFSSVAIPRRLLKGSMAPILSLKRAGISKASTGQFFAFLLRVAALEAIRRVSKGRCPQVWWGLQGISLLQAPPFSWFQRWTPVRHLVESTQSFSKPLIFLSLAMAVSSAVDEIKHASDPIYPPQPTPEERPVVQGGEGPESREMNALRETLERAEVSVPDRFGDDDLKNFSVAANGNSKRFISKVQKSIKWRQNYYFLNSEALKRWSHLVSWHDVDTKARPVLVIHLGPAYNDLHADDRPRFCQAVVSQVEFGVLHLLNDLDPRITVILDCKGISAIGFPMNMMKHFAVLVQDHYPTRLAALYAVHLPPVVRVVSAALLQVVSPNTRQKLHLLGDVYMMAISDLLGGTDKVPASIDGACHCPDCLELRTAAHVHQVSYDSNHLEYIGRGGHPVELQDDEPTQQTAYEEDHVTDYQSYNNVLRLAIIGFLMLWVLIALVAGHHEPHHAPT